VKDRSSDEVAVEGQADLADQAAGSKLTCHLPKTPPPGSSDGYRLIGSLATLR
jgi:hypothetical protein